VSSSDAISGIFCATGRILVLFNEIHFKALPNVQDALLLFAQSTFF
jgi:hypothetical protein